MLNWFNEASSPSSDQGRIKVSSGGLAIEEPKDALQVDQFPTAQHTADGSGHDSDRIDTTIAQALGNLSLQERDKVYHEMHGVEAPIEESPEMIRQALEEFQVGVDDLVHRTRHSCRAAYEQLLALERNGASAKGIEYYWKDPSFQLAFLRADRFVVSEAADRFLRFFDLKLHLFGPTKLHQRRITLQDFNKEDMKTLKAGFMQLLPVRDRAGRAILCLLPNFQTYKDPENFTRVMYYLIMSAVEDAETQIKGCCCIVYSIAGEFVQGKTDLRTVSAGPWCLRSLPFRACAMHQCFRDPAYRAILNFMMRFVGAKDRARIKVHYGSNVECIYALMTYGIPSDSLPVTSEGDLKRKIHMDWIKIRRQHESLPPTARRIVVPSQSDILFGRGKPFRQHVGNIRLHNLLEEKLHIYMAAKTKEKTILIANLVDEILVEGGRFLKQDGGPWYEVDLKQAREKVSHGFRTRMKLAIAATSEGGRQPSTSTIRRMVNYSSESESNATTSPLTSPISSPLLSFDDHAAASANEPIFVPDVAMSEMTDNKRARYNYSPDMEM